MSQTFAEIVDDVKQLSVIEKQELQEFLRKYLIEERRAEICKNAEAGLQECRDGKLEFFLSADDMMDSLSHD